MRGFADMGSSMSYSKRRKIQFGIGFTSAFFIGAENAVIYPTAWKYLQDLGVTDEHVLGYVISAFSVSALILGFIMGPVSDRFSNSRNLILILNVFNIIGNTLYLIGLSPWVLIAGRFVAGMGNAAGTVIMADFARASSKKERTKILTIGYGCRQLGTLLGPAYNIGLSSLNFYIGPLHINEGNIPGLILASIWLLYEIIIFFFYTNVHIDFACQEQETERTSLLPKSRCETSSRCSSDQSNQDEFKLSVKFYVEAMLSQEALPLVFQTVVMMFLQSMVEASIPLVMDSYFGLGTQVNSFIYLMIGLEAIFMYGFAIAFNRIFGDLNLVFCSNVLIVLSLLLFMVNSVIYFQPGHTPSLAFFLCSCALMFIAVPLGTVTSSALFSKVVPRTAQGMAQGARRIFLYLGMVPGPLWAGGLLHQSFVLNAGALIFSLVGTALLIFSRKEILEKSQTRT